MSPTPVVTIVVPAHDRADLLPDTLDSVVHQTYADWECVIVDDHSRDATAVVAQSYAARDERFRVVQLPVSRRGANAARNAGLAQARGEYVTFLDSDDLYAPCKIEQQVAAFRQDPALDLVSCRHVWFTRTPEHPEAPPRFAAPAVWMDAIWNAPVLGGLWATPSAMWRVATVTALGGWNESLKAWMDPELNVRALLAGSRILRLDAALVYCRRDTPDGISAQPDAVKIPAVMAGLVATWRHVQNAHQVTALRRTIVCDRLLEFALRGAHQTGLKSGLRSWARVATEAQLGPANVMLGAAAILTCRRRLLRKSHRRLLRRFTAYRNRMPKPLPDAPAIVQPIRD